MSRSVLIWSAAKINLYLEVSPLDEHNYHPLRTVFQTIDLYDQLEMLLETTGNSTNNIDIYVDSGQDIGPIEDNLIYKAAMSYWDAVGLTGNNLQVQLKKNIPAGAGLAGGSGNAAATLYALNEVFFDQLLPQNELLSVASKLGKDIPFCYLGGRMLGTGYGDQLLRLPIHDNLPVVIIYPPQNEALSTPDVYAQFDSIQRSPIDPADFEFFVSALMNNDMKYARNNMHNDLEESAVVLSYWIEEVKSFLEANGYMSLLSGSGSAVFSLCRSEDEAQRLVKLLEESKYKASLHYFTDKPFQIISTP